MGANPFIGIMFLNNRIIRIFKRILIMAGSPKIRLLSKQKWNKKFPKYKINQWIFGRCDLYGIIAVRGIHKGIKNTIWHEILHILFPSKRHWWIECAAQKLSHSYRRGFFSTKYHKHMKNVPDIPILLKLVNKSAKRFNQKV